MSSFLQADSLEQLILVKVESFWDASGQYWQGQWDRFLSVVGKH
jgi:hypothetical protein